MTDKKLRLKYAGAYVVLWAVYTFIYSTWGNLIVTMNQKFNETFDNLSQIAFIKLGLDVIIALFIIGAMWLIVKMINEDKKLKWVAILIPFVILIIAYVPFAIAPFTSGNITVPVLTDIIFFVYTNVKYALTLVVVLIFSLIYGFSKKRVEV